MSIGIDGVQTSTPIYVSEQVMVAGTASLTPVDIVLVWFEQDIKTSTMFSNARSNPIQIDLTTEDSATRLYKGGQWTTPSR
jgi:hypothetical protein